MKAFSDNGKSNAISQTILFKHNQDYMDEIGSLAKQYGSLSHTFIKSDRFPFKDGKYSPDYFINENGEEETLEWADIEFEKPFITHYNVHSHQINNQIVCKWALDNMLNINFDGQVWPCCYFGNNDHSVYHKSFKNNDIIKEYNLMRLDSNVKFTPLKEIIKNKWFDGSLQKSIDENPITQCSKHCSTQIKDFDKQQLRTRH